MTKTFNSFIERTGGSFTARLTLTSFIDGENRMIQLVQGYPEYRWGEGNDLGCITLTSYDAQTLIEHLEMWLSREGL